jgi:serine/threonine protein kinase
MQVCDSPNLLKCFEVMENDELKILILEYCSGKNLQEYIDEKKSLPEEEAIGILKQIINGIAVNNFLFRNFISIVLFIVISRQKILWNITAFIKL